MPRLNPTYGAAALALACACIIPDRDIRIEGAQPQNQAAVRIIERAPITPQMIELCERDPQDDPGPEPGFCPQVRSTAVPSGLVRPSSGEFCICPNGDNRAARDTPSFEIYAEDVEISQDEPVDTLYGVFLLDPDPDSDDPFTDVAFGRYWFPGKEGERISPLVRASEDDPYEVSPSVGREASDQFVFAIDDGSGVVDFCNPSSGDVVGPGLHNLVFMVTDREFFEPPKLVEDVCHPYEQVVNHNGEPVFLSIENGVPDLAGGATYDTTNFVFRCLDPSDPETPPGVCDCAEPS